jgi:hypothetical protein
VVCLTTETFGSAMNITHSLLPLLLLSCLAEAEPQPLLATQDPSQPSLVSDGGKVTEPKIGSPERKAIMDAMRPEIMAHVGAPVLFTGDVRVCGEWARFQGNVTTKDGKRPKNEEAAADLELDFFALLCKDSAGAWQLLHHGFAGDISVGEEAQAKFPDAPSALFQ